MDKNGDGYIRKQEILEYVDADVSVLYSDGSLDSRTGGMMMKWKDEPSYTTIQYAWKTWTENNPSSYTILLNIYI